MFRSKATTVIITIILNIFSLNVWAIDFNKFESSSYKKILERNKNKEFLLVLWSIDCPPCHEELHSLGQYLKNKPDFKVVLVSIDSLVDRDEIAQILTTKSLHTQENWMFSNTHSNQLRYSIDPSWYGELPRNYLFNRCHQRKSLSGKINLKDIDLINFNKTCK